MFFSNWDNFWSSVATVLVHVNQQFELPLTGKLNKSKVS